MAQKTLEQHVEDFKKKHGETYDYSESEIVRTRLNGRTRSFVSVKCRTHGDFSINIDDHKQGRGCTLCGNIQKGVTQKAQAENIFFSKMKNIHPEYDFSLFEYQSSRTKSIVICPTHGQFKAPPVTLVGGHKCQKCYDDRRGKTLAKSPLKALEDLIAVHGDRYDYSEFEYRGSEKNIYVICKEHGKFKTPYDCHRQGHGCHKCAKNGYQANKPGSIYILTCDNIVKVGITNRKVISRVKGINKSSGLDFKIHSYHYFDDGSVPRDVERNLLDYLKQKYQKVDQSFNGSTECFLDVDVSDLENQLYLLLGERNDL